VAMNKGGARRRNAVELLRSTAETAVNHLVRGAEGTIKTAGLPWMAPIGTAAQSHGYRYASPPPRVLELQA
jgi:hypothetical protein